MPVEATEQAGPVIIWRKELRPDSGGAGEFIAAASARSWRSAPADGHEFDFSAMFDRVNHPARGRRGGADGRADHDRAGRRHRDARQGQAVRPRTAAGCMLAFPGGGGYGPAAARDRAQVSRDLALGYISAEAARDSHGLDRAEIDRVLAAARLGDFTE